MLLVLHPDHLYQAGVPVFSSIAAVNIGCEWHTAAASLENHPQMMGVVYSRDAREVKSPSSPGWPELNG